MIVVALAVVAVGSLVAGYALLRRALINGINFAKGMA